MAWFRRECGLRGHLKTRRLASRLGLNDHEAVGLIDEMFDWATRHAKDGKLTRGDDELLARSIKLDRHNEEETIDALIEAGFIDRTRWGYVFHGFIERNGRHLQEADKKREYRARVRRKSAPASADSPAVVNDKRDVTKRLEPESPRAEIQALDAASPTDLAKAGAAPAGTAGSHSRPEAEAGTTGIPPLASSARRGMASAGSLVSGVLGQLAPPPAAAIATAPLSADRPNSPNRGTLTGADLSTEAGVIAEREAQLEALRRSEQRKIGTAS